jgi:hypothetical protein
VSTYVAVQVVFAPGASVVAGQSTAPTSGSETAIPSSVTLPVLVTTNVYGRVAPAVAVFGVPASF